LDGGDRRHPHEAHGTGGAAAHPHGRHQRSGRRQRALRQPSLAKGKGSTPLRLVSSHAFSVTSTPAMDSVSEASSPDSFKFRQGESDSPATLLAIGSALEEEKRSWDEGLCTSSPLQFGLVQELSELANRRMVFVDSPGSSPGCRTVLSPGSESSPVCRSEGDTQGSSSSPRRSPRQANRRQGRSAPYAAAQASASAYALRGGAKEHDGATTRPGPLNFRRNCRTVDVSLPSPFSRSSRA